MSGHLSSVETPTSEPGGTWSGPAGAHSEPRTVSTERETGESRAIEERGEEAFQFDDGPGVEEAEMGNKCSRTDNEFESVELNRPVILVSSTGSVVSKQSYLSELHSEGGMPSCRWQVGDHCDEASTDRSERSEREQELGHFSESNESTGGISQSGDESTVSEKQTQETAVSGLAKVEGMSESNVEQLCLGLTENTTSDDVIGKESEQSIRPPASTNSSGTPSKQVTPGRSFRLAWSTMDFGTCDIDTCVRMIPVPSLKVYVAMNKKIKESSPSWVEDFVEARGLSALLDTVDVISTLDTPNTTLKDQIFQLLSALTLYSDDGLKATIQALDTCKVRRKQRYRFSLLINELRNHGDNHQYMVTIVGFVNCLIEAHDDLDARNAIRNEFIGLNILDILDGLQDTGDDQLDNQLNQFYEGKELDDQLLALDQPDGIDITSPIHVFSSVLEKAHLAKKVALLTSERDINKFMDTTRSDKKQYESGSTQTDPLHYAEKSPQGINRSFASDDSFDDSFTTPPSSPKPVPKGGSLDIGALAPSRSGTEAPPPSPISGVRARISGPPPLTSTPVRANTQSFIADMEGRLLTPRLESNLLQGIVVPKPRLKMKTINWIKLPQSEVSKPCVWKEVLATPDPVPIKYHELEELFSQKPTISEPKTGTTKERKKPSEVNLLPSKTSLKVNIFLKQFKCSTSEIIEMIVAGEVEKIGIDRVKGLQGILPNKEEHDMIKCYDGDRVLLAPAEQFYASLLDVPKYELRINGMVLTRDFPDDYDGIHPNVKLLTQTIEDVVKSESLKEFLRCALHIGNFINAGSYASNALGFKIISVLKLAEIRSCKPRVTLLHYIVKEAELENPHMLQMPLKTLPSDIKELGQKLNKLKKQLKSCDKSLKDQFEDFIQVIGHPGLACYWIEKYGQG
ncbi:hypothetical protein LSH36_14g03033 [Paralvinella palmiformis]|uniref:FH2 domain-containing protein n=1 Tax=Paralvinella palmiformis TaxID=53620 RepID=A0AAD9KCM2_9ANNE|nr:hypothetical protein LSH36_14g03033 [Paralvinella palmiformis]